MDTQTNLPTENGKFQILDLKKPRISRKPVYLHQITKSTKIGIGKHKKLIELDTIFENVLRGSFAYKKRV